MLFDPKHEQHLGALEQQLHCAHALTPDLISDVIAKVCPRFAAHGPATRTEVGRLIEAGVWIDAVLAIIQLELPSWKLRRLIYEDGEWHSSLSRQPQLPFEFDDVAEASHVVLPLAILIAFLQARRVTASSVVSLTAVPQVRPTSGYAVCCDNFA